MTPNQCILTMFEVFAFLTVVREKYWFGVVFFVDGGCVWGWDLVMVVCVFWAGFCSL